MGRGSCKASVVSKTIQINWNVLAFFTPKSELPSTTGENHTPLLMSFTLFSRSSTSRIEATWNHSSFPSQFKLSGLSRSFLPVFHPPSWHLGNFSRAPNLWVTEVTGRWTGRPWSPTITLLSPYHKGPVLYLGSESPEAGALSLVFNTRLILLFQAPFTSLVTHSSENTVQNWTRSPSHFVPPHLSSLSN